VVTGGGQHNGLLLRAIGEQLPDIPLIRLTDLGIPSEAFGPALVGLLAALHLDQMPAATTAITGAEEPCVLGRLTPGSPHNWRNLLRSMTTPRTTLRALREAV
jgi:anhydro-N-acetylmuramic acid kinase